MSLEEYNRKRRFARTSEPEGALAQRAGAALSFVVQLHHARARHYDFRLEVDGVLRSWAVPRGPSLRPGEKRLAVETEDHPLAYGGFAGVIPEGEYGAGHMAIFDHGTWQPEGDEHEGIRKGRLDFRLDGERLKGRWSLIRTRARGGRGQWMLLKRTDEFAADLEADDLIADLPPPPPDAPGASTRAGLEIRARKGFDMATQTSAPPRAPAAKARTSKRAVATGTRAARAPAAAATPHASSSRDLPALKREARRLAAGARYPLGEFVQPMLTVSAAKAPPGDEWIHEWKWDGYRLLAQSGSTPLLWSRNGIPWNARAPELVRALQTLGSTAVLDGELIAVDRTGYSDFNALQRALSEKDATCLRFVAFDLLSLDGHDLRGAPLLERKSMLERLLDGADPRFFYSTHIVGRGPDIFDAARGRGMEGIISKRADSRYEDGRSARWLKIKTAETREFVVVGYTPPKGGRQGLGSLMLGTYRDGALVYVGRVGSGMGNDLLLALHKRLRATEVSAPVVDIPAHAALPKGRIQWVRPELVVEVYFRGWGKEGLVRQASFHRVRDDKPATPESLQQPDTVASPGVELGGDDDGRKNMGKATGAESVAKKTVKKVGAKTLALKKAAPKKVIKTAALKAVPAQGTPAGRAATAAARKAASGIGTAPAKASGARAAARSGKRTGGRAAPRIPQLSSPERVVYPGDGYTKQDVFDYYLAVAPRLLDEIGGRLLSIVRCPNGIGGQQFFQKHARAGFGDAVKDFALVENDGDEASYLYVDDVEGLMTLVQMNALEFHPWGSHIDALEQPDRIVFDLDPDPSIGWTDIKTAAKDVRERLLQVGLESFPKLSGGKGVHVVAPLKPQADWEQVRRFCEAFADAMESEAPERYVATMSKAKRKGRIFIDWLRNGRGATSVASWSLRARPGAPAAVPLTWAELSRVRTPQRYTLENAAKRSVPDEVLALQRKARPLPV